LIRKSLPAGDFFARLRADRIEQAGLQIGVDRHLFAGHAVEGKAGPHSLMRVAPFVITRNWMQSE